MEIPFHESCALIRESSIKAITRVIKDAALACGPSSLCCLEERVGEEGENAASTVMMWSTEASQPLWVVVFSLVKM